MVLISGTTFSAMGASKLLPVYNAIFTCRIAEYFFIVVHRDFKVLHLPYLFEYKSHACISRTLIFDMKNRTKLF